MPQDCLVLCSLVYQSDVRQQPLDVQGKEFREIVDAKPKKTVKMVPRYDNGNYHKH